MIHDKTDAGRQRAPTVSIGGGPIPHYPVASGEDGEFVSVWVGTFGSRAAVDVYVTENYADDETPISRFAADIGLRFYDHDFFERNYEPGLSAKESEAFSGHSYGPSFAEQTWEAVQQKRLGEFDTVFMLYNYAYERHSPSTHLPQQVRFVGTFPFRREQTERLKLKRELPEQRKFVSVWVGTAASERALARYIQDFEQDGVWREAPFCIDHQLKSYGDAEYAHFDTPSTSIRKLLRAFPHSQMIASALDNICGQILPEYANAIVLLYGIKYDGRIESVTRESVRLRFLGAVKFK